MLVNMDFLKSNTYLLILTIISLISFIGLIVIIIKTNNQNKRYKKMLEKLGNGNNIEQDIITYVEKVENVEKQNEEIINYCQNIDNNIRKCVQKIGMVRYNAFQDTGSNLSFAVALLDAKNTGIVVNGIYSRDCSNIYSKPIENGKSNFVLSEEEKEAISLAIKNEGLYVIK